MGPWDCCQCKKATREAISASWPTLKTLLKALRTYGLEVTPLSQSFSEPWQSLWGYWNIKSKLIKEFYLIKKTSPIKYRKKIYVWTFWWREILVLSNRRGATRGSASLVGIQLFTPPPQPFFCRLTGMQPLSTLHLSRKQEWLPCLTKQMFLLLGEGCD